jgi:hypothetical protein
MEPDRLCDLREPLTADPAGRACRLPRHVKRAGLLAVAVPLAAAGPASAGAPIPSSVERSVTLPADGTRSLTLRCPGEGVALSGAVSSSGTGTAGALDSIPNPDGRSWTFRFASGAGADRRRAAAVLRCMRVRVPRAVRRVRLLTATRRDPDVTVPGGSTRRAALRCPPGFVPTGWGHEGLPPGELRVAAAVPGRGGWEFRLENPGAAVASGTLHIRCLERAQRGRGRGRALRHGFRVRRASFRDGVRVGDAGPLAHSCRSSEFSVATGSWLAAGVELVLGASHPTGERGGRWTFDHRGGRREPVRTYLLCLDLGSRWR